MDTILSEYEEGKSALFLSRKHNLSKYIILKRLRKAGCKIRPNWKYYDYNFKIPRGHKKYWFLGFISADGYVNHKFVTIELHRKDIDILYKIKEICSSSHPIKYRKNRPHCYLRLPKVFADLCRSFNINQNKSLTLDFPDINKKYLYDYICGYFDGDGHIGFIPSGKIVGYVSSGSLKFLKKLNTLLSENKLSGKIRGTYGKYRLDWNTTTMPLVCNTMYKNVTGGKRKWSTYKKFREGVTSKPCQ